MCTKELAQQYLAPTLKALSMKGGKDCDHASISSEDFVVISVEGEGLDAGQRVVELTSPLALAGMYVSDSLSLKRSAPEGLHGLSSFLCLLKPP